MKRDLTLWVALLAALQLGCPDKGPTQAERNARLAKKRKAMEEADRAEEEARAVRQAALGNWPPRQGAQHPEMTLFDLEGQEVKLSTFKGKVILLQWVATTSPGSIGLAGGLKAKAFKRTPSQQGVTRLDRALAEAGAEVDSDEFVWLQVMVYGPGQGVPTQVDAQEWSEHFGLAERPRTHVLYTDQRYQVDATHAMVPGFYLIDTEFNLAFDATDKLGKGHRAALRGAKALFNLRPVLPAYSPSASPRSEKIVALASLLMEGKFKELDAEIAKLVEQGCRKDEPGRTHLESVEDLYAVEGVTEEHYQAWIEASPESFVPAYFKGMAHVSWGWDARGSGWASTVTEEGWEIFGRELQKAKEAFTLANRISSSQAYGYTGLLIVARALRAPTKIREAYFEAAIQADPDYLAAYEMKLEDLYPKWGGTAEAALQFVYGSMEARPDYVPLETLVPRLHYEFSRTVVKDGKAYLNQKQVVGDCVGAIRRVREAYPKSRQINRVALKIAKTRQEGVLAAAKRLAELGDPWGMGQYGFYLKWGRQGAKVDLDKAHEYLLASGRAGDVIGAGQVAQSLLYHPAFKHDPARAIPWLMVSASGSPGYDFAQEALGDAYFYGRGVERDLEVAARWYTLARTRYARQQLEKLVEEAAKMGGAQPR